ncbi:hypothetical protein BS47DRAFT_694616 [Hydnum rufescens UP504]|uniref:Uncharacterized protein n=1 Tax=Hydnum rufescens UP504 TaxID=1448309 RepID=A0A9P6AF81_9AGAM|nr:hypothetical protein BS47DRAFT_694616 [Hydnum rufescens UP504]
MDRRNEYSAMSRISDLFEQITKSLVRHFGLSIHPHLRTSRRHQQAILVIGGALGRRNVPQFQIATTFIQPDVGDQRIR